MTWIAAETCSWIRTAGEVRPNLPTPHCPAFFPLQRHSQYPCHNPPKMEFIPVRGGEFSSCRCVSGKHSLVVSR